MRFDCGWYYIYSLWSSHLLGRACWFSYFASCSWIILSTVKCPGLMTSTLSSESCLRQHSQTVKMLGSALFVGELHDKQTEKEAVFHFSYQVQ